MIVAAATALLTLSLSQYPDELDHLKQGGAKPQVILLLDSSGSMRWGFTESQCSNFPRTSYEGVYTRRWPMGYWSYCSDYLPCDNGQGDCDRHSECRSGYCGPRIDQVFPKPDGFVNPGSGSTYWPTKVHLCQDPPAGVTPKLYLNKTDQMKAALTGCRTDDDGILDNWSGKVNFSVMHFGGRIGVLQDFNSTKEELEAAVLAVPDTGGTPMTRALRDAGRHFNSSFTNATVTDTQTCRPNFIIMLSDGEPNGSSATFTHDCSNPRDMLKVSGKKPEFGAAYLHNHTDVLCNLDGDQNIDTYAIGFGSGAGTERLKSIARYGGGEYYYAANVDELNEAFESVVAEIVSKSALTMAPAAVAGDALYDGNYAYTPAFRPSSTGPWEGTIKKYCVNPPLTSSGNYDTSAKRCMFISKDGKTLLTNPNVQDQWTGSVSLDAGRGGAADVLKARLRTDAGVLKKPFWGRSILTWRPDGDSYVAVQPGSWTSHDSWTNGCEHDRLLAYLNGYTWDVDCDTHEPLAVRKTPLGDPIHFDPLVLPFGPCEDEDGNAIKGNCFVASGMNDGMLHLFDAADGSESSALVPSELWTPYGVASSNIQALQEQPNLEYTHRYYVDGSPRLYHVDTDADGIIDDDEDASLIFGLGRGGKAYYALSLTKMEDGKIEQGKTPIYPLVHAENTAFKDLEDTWAAPWLGRVMVNKKPYTAAVFPSGHVRSLDFDEGDNATVSAPSATPDLDDAITLPCEGRDGFAVKGSLGSGWCTEMYQAKCTNETCYDSNSDAPEPIVQSLLYHEDNYIPAALRVHFSKFNIDPNDEVRIEDEKNNVVASFTGADLALLEGAWSPWVYGAGLRIRIIPDGKSNSYKGYSIDQMQWVRGAQLNLDGTDARPGRDPNFTLGESHHPTIYVVDMAKWNGSKKPQPFARVPSDDGILFRITNDCDGVDAAHCIDKSNYSDLKNMKCPISAEVTPYTEGGVMTAMYWGDECGQIWKAWTVNEGKKWKVRRVINLNGGHIGMTQDYRKIFRRLDLVVSSCPGKVVRALHFGTGNVQHPISKSELRDTSITNGQDLIGLVWDNTPNNTTESGLADVTDAPQTTASQIVADGKHGWYVRLEHTAERMLRDPFVLDGVAYYKTYQPITMATECGAGSGLDRIYAVDNCAANPEKGDKDDKDNRIIWSGNTEIGSNIFFTTPKNGRVVVSHGNLATEEKASLTDSTRTRPGLYLWREK